ncbi:MAG: type III-A CRISPR-associated RAMP protein Csm4 [Armatimonadota bacterium]
MPDAVLYRLHFRSPLHIGERGVGLEETRTCVPADTLFSALCTAWRWLYGIDSLQSELLAAFVHGENPPFLLSSTFPFAGKILFFPKPIVQVDVPEGYRRKLRASKYWSQSVFARWVQGQSPDYEPLAREEEPLFWVLEEERDALEPFVDEETGSVRLWKEGVVPRVTLDRITSASQIWFFGQVAFRQSAGLWCAIRYREAQWRSRVEACLRLLGDSGLGGERGAGFGLFEVSVSENVSLPEVEEAEYMVSLSPCCPDGDQWNALFDTRCGYDLLPRRGWVGSPEGGNFRRKTVWMLKEGSVLRKAGGTVVGRLVNVKPDPCPHDVWRYGYAFALGVNR